MLLQELNEVDNSKEGEALKKNLMQRHGQLAFADKLAGMKRSSDILMDDMEYNDMMDQANAPNKRSKFAEAFEDLGDMFALHHWVNIIKTTLII